MRILMQNFISCISSLIVKHTIIKRRVLSLPKEIMSKHSNKKRFNNNYTNKKVFFKKNTAQKH